jgi:V8-like Glu-specific endopeptidase
MKRAVLSLLVVALCAPMAADEGMWTFDSFPRVAVKQKYGVDVTDAWLTSLRSRIARLENGCTGSFVSGSGLVLTNHHCAQSCLAENSSASRDLVADGFLAATADQEIRCQSEQISVLVGSEDVTARVTSEVQAAPAAEATTVRNKAFTSLEQACEERAAKAGAPLKCETVTLYQGGQYWLYKYKRYTDVRLAFAPESAVASFGGDPDNFQFPRWCLDMTLLRVYENGKPAVTPDHLAVDWNGAADGAPVFVAGHPGSTDRLLTVAQLKSQRDVFLPFWLLRMSELRGRLIQFSKTSPEASRRAKDILDSIENSIKVRRMEQVALNDDTLMASKEADENKLREAVEKNPALRASARTAWDDIAKAERVNRAILVPYVFLEGGAAFNSDLFVYARQLVRAADERTKPNAARLREYTDARLAQLEQALEAESPVYPDLEQVRLSYSLERMREWLGPDHAVVKTVLGASTPDERARELVTGSRLADPRTRVALLERGAAAVAASDDPMLRLARAVDAEARALRTRFENEVEAPIERAQQAIAEARFKVFGTSLYPDATFTLRLSYGAVAGWEDPAGGRVAPFTTLDRLYGRATGAPPFKLPATWLDAKLRLDPTTRANFVTTNDIVGGNSGSPMVNAAGRLVGLVFDGNIHSISGSYWFDLEKNRTVAVHPAYIRTALRSVYPAGRLADELRIPK